MNSTHPFLLFTPCSGVHMMYLPLTIDYLNANTREIHVILPVFTPLNKYSVQWMQMAAKDKPCVQYRAKKDTFSAQPLEWDLFTYDVLSLEIQT